MYYIQRKRNLDETVASDGIVKFDTSVAQSGTDFQYNGDGSIDILKAGVFVISWVITQMTGLATNGQAFQLKKMDYAAQTPEWVSIVGTSNHVKIAALSGFGTVDVSAEEIKAHGKATIALFNASDSGIKLTHHAHAKAGILVFGLDVAALQSRVTSLEQENVNIYERISTIEAFLYLSDVTELWSTLPALLGLGSGAIHSGYTHNFWGIGTLNHTQTLSNGGTYYLITAAQYEPLSYYQGESTIGTLWIEVPGSPVKVYTMPIRFDKTGIYFRPTEQLTNLPVGTTFKFTQALILVEQEGRA